MKIRRFFFVCAPLCVKIHFPAAGAQNRASLRPACRLPVLGWRFFGMGVAGRIYFLFSKVALRRLRRSNPSASTDPKQSATARKSGFFVFGTADKLVCNGSSEK